MSLYINNGSKEPTDIYYQNKIVNSVFFNNKLVWGEDLDIDDWQEIVNVVEDKKNGVITEWPTGYYEGKVFTILLDGTTDYWDQQFINIRIIKLNDTSLVFSVYEPSGYLTYYDINDLYNFKGYKNSNPRLKCLELESLLPFKNYLKKKTFTTTVYTVLEVADGEITNSTETTEEISDGVFLPTWVETQLTSGSSNVPDYDFYYSDLGNPTSKFWLRGGDYFSTINYGGLIYYTMYGNSSQYSRLSSFNDTYRMMPLFEIG